MKGPPMRVLLHSSDTTDLRAAFEARFPQVTVAECTDYDNLPGLIADFNPDVVYTVRFGGSIPYPKEALFAEGGPAWVANGGAGTDHFGHWDPARTTVTNAAGAAAEMMAEYIFGGFLHFTLDVPGLQADQSSRVWRMDRTVRPLKGKTLLIVGLGHTGRAVAALAKAFGMYVIGTRARPVEMEHVDEVHSADGLHALLPRADCIAVATPLVPQTRGLLAAAAFAKMKPGVLLADVSRGGVIEPTALLTALQDGTVAGAALDVFEAEPLPERNAFWGLPNVILSPHCSSVYDEWAEVSFDIFLTNFDRWQKGEALKNVVDPARGY